MPEAAADPLVKGAGEDEEDRDGAVVGAALGLVVVAAALPPSGANLANTGCAVPGAGA